MSARIVTVLNQKGGCGKTIVSMRTVGTLGLQGSKTLLVDMDEQEMIMRWAAQAPEDKPFPAPMIGLAPFDGVMHREVCKSVADYDYIMIDCPPTIHSPSSSSALPIPDVALIPTIPSPPDPWVTMTAKVLMQQAQVINETFRIRVPTSIVQRRVSLTEQVIKVLGGDGDIPLMDSMIGSHLAFRECQTIGAAVHGVPGAWKTTSEVDLLTDEALQLLQEKRA